MQNPGSDGLATQKMSSGELAEKISGLWVNAKLFEKGLKLFDGKGESWFVCAVVQCCCCCCCVRLHLVLFLLLVSQLVIEYRPGQLIRQY